MFAFLRRMSFFVILNTALVTTFFFIVNLLPIQPGYYGTIIPLYALIGFGGALVSLFISRWSAKRRMGVQVIDPKNPGSETEKWLVDTVHNFARMSRFKKMPEVGIYNGQELNAFATGPSKSKSLVAVSTGLLNSMTKDEVEGVLAHEVAHIKNGDMVTMVLLMGTINTLVMIVARVLADVVSSAMSKNERGGYFMRMMLYQVFAMVIGILGSVVTNYFSRQREYRADAGGARLAGRDKMTKALERLQGSIPQAQTVRAASAMNGGGADEMASLKISGRSRSGFSIRKLLSTHPPLEDRIRRLKTGR